LPLLYTTANHYLIVSATTGVVAMTDNHANAPDDAVMVSVLSADGPPSIIVEAPLTVIALAEGCNNTATITFTLATTMMPAANTSVPTAQTLIAPMPAASEIENAQSLVNTMTAVSKIENNAHFPAPPPPNVTTSATRFPPNTYCLDKEDIVGSLLSSGAGGLNEDTTLAEDGEMTGVASSAGGLDEDAPQDVPAEEPPVILDDMELHYYKLHKASFNVPAFPPGKVRASNTQFKPMIRSVLQEPQSNQGTRLHYIKNEAWGGNRKRFPVSTLTYYFKLQTS
jgi:hypothetical protein